MTATHSTASIDTLDPRWSGTTHWADVLWTWKWEKTQGVFSYALLRDPHTKEYTVSIERVDAGRTRYLGPFVNHTTATQHVLDHLEGKR